MSDKEWVAEAIVDFLRGPLYVNPLMAFIDEHCLIFTPEEENKLEYTTIHGQFKDLVDKLLTDFLAELGMSPEAFFEVVAGASDKDKLTQFVVQTILTVDDFLMFKAMMVKRNTDLTTQVLAQYEELESAFSQKETARALLEQFDGGDIARTKDEESAMLQMAVELSKVEGGEAAKASALQALMRKFQLQDEDVALAIAIANSLMDMARREAELAELEQAIALSLALEAEQKRLQAAAEAAGTAEGIRTQRPDRPTSAKLAEAAAAGAAAAAASKAAASASLPPVKGPTDFGAPTVVQGAGPLKSFAIGAGSGPSKGAEDRSARPSKPSEDVPAFTPLLLANPGAAGLKEVADKAGQAAAAATSGSKQAGYGDVVASRAGGLPAQQAPGKEEPQGLGELDFSAAGPRRAFGAVPEVQDLLVAGGVAGAKAAANLRNRGAGYSGGPGGSASGPLDLEAIREAAKAAAEAQKKIPGGRGSGNDEASAWLREQKEKLVAAKQAERHAEMEQYKKDMAGKPKPKGLGLGPPSAADREAELEAKRQQLRDKLAQKLKQDILTQNMAV